jgi:hypothetical protein
MAKVDFDTAKLTKTVNTKASQVIRKIIIDGMTRLIRQSPVDTGRFKANWSTSINEMSLGTATDTKENISKSIKGISSYQLGQTAFLHNNLEYALPLEYGSSKQAPVGWIRNTAEEIQNLFNKIQGLL